jgi:hypothetical protein
MGRKQKEWGFLPFIKEGNDITQRGYKWIHNEKYLGIGAKND